MADLLNDELPIIRLIETLGPGEPILAAVLHDNLQAAINKVLRIQTEINQIIEGMRENARQDSAASDLAAPYRQIGSAQEV
jgi:hypothetical protein